MGSSPSQRRLNNPVRLCNFAVLEICTYFARLDIYGRLPNQVFISRNVTRCKLGWN
jgi:hypothetical protein